MRLFYRKDIKALCIVLPATTLWSVSHRCKLFGFMHYMFYSLKIFLNVFFQIWLPCWPNFILKLSAFPAPIHRPDHVSQCTVQHKGVEEPIYRCCCNLHALRQRIQCLSGYLMSLLKGNDCFTMYESWVITSLRTSGMLYVCFVFISPSKLVWYKNMK